MARFRMTVRGTGIELRGWVEEEHLVAFANALAKGMSPHDPMIVYSPVDPDYNPFQGQPVTNVDLPEPG